MGYQCFGNPHSFLNILFRIKPRYSENFEGCFISTNKLRCTISEYEEWLLYPLVGEVELMVRVGLYIFI